MNKQVQKLYDVSRKNKRNIIGLMSGTSLDGLDVAFCTIEGSGKATRVQLNDFETIVYSENTRNIIRKIFAKENAYLKDVCQINKWLATEQARMINDLIKKWKIQKDNIDLIASHGQTIYHAPDETFEGENINSTLQITDGDHLAQLTGIITISDFRQKHVAGGGEGAPLALYGDYILFGNNGVNTVLLNIGGIANFTFLPGNQKKIICSDIGPGNTLMDSWMQHQYNLPMDRNGEKARHGKVDESFLQSLLGHPFFTKSFPKTCGQELFNFSFIEETLSSQQPVSSEDVMATLNKLTVVSIIQAIHTIIDEKFDLYISGGGIHNQNLMDQLQQCLPLANICSVKTKGITADSKEAVLFAILANETVAGNAAIFEDAGIFPAVSFGKISFPD